MEAMTKKFPTTKQGVRDLNYYGPRLPKNPPTDQVGNEPNQTSAVKTDDKAVTSPSPDPA